MSAPQPYHPPAFMYLIWASLTIAIAVSLYLHLWPALFSSLATLALSLYSIHLCRTIDFHVPNVLITSAVIFIYGTIFLGEAVNFYEKFWWWDVLMHTGSALGFGLIGVIVLVYIFGRRKVATHPMMLAVFSFAFALAIGVLWEIFEYAVDQFFGTNMQKSGLDDTMLDLIVDTVGAVIAAAAGYLYVSGHKELFSPITEVIEEAVENTP